MYMRFQIPCCVGLALSLVIAVGCEDSSRSQGVATPVAQAAGDASGVALFGSDGFLAWNDGVLRQRYKARNFSQVIVVDQYWEAATGGWGEPVVHSESAPFTVYQVASAGADEYCVAGFNRADELVVEKWSLEAAVPGSRGLFGPPLQLGLNGEVLSKDFVRVRVYEGDLGAELLSVGYDPERRSILTLTRADSGEVSLHKLDAAASAVPELISNSNQVPELGDVAHLSRGDHKQHGLRVWTMIRADLTTDTRVMFFDVENDGVFDGDPWVGDRDFFENAGLAWTYGDWDSGNGTGN